MKYKPTKGERWISWTGEVVGYFNDIEKERFHMRHIYTIKSCGKYYHNIHINQKSPIRKKSLPIIGDIVELSYYRHRDSFDDNKNKSIIEKVIS